MKALAPATAILVLACLGCSNPGPQGQILLHVVTDAPAPGGPGDPASSSETAPLFDLMRIEFFKCDAQTCKSAGSRDFPLTSGRIAAGLSVGFMPPAGRSGYRARVRIYNDLLVRGTEPIPETTLSATVELPPAHSEGIVEGTVVLWTRDVGRPQGDLDKPSAWTPGAPGSAPESWPDARRTACADTPKKGEVCIPGGAFWLGNPLVYGGQLRDDPPAPRLTVLPPYFLDETEVTVGAFRTWLRDHPEYANEGDPVEGGPATSTSTHAWCTFQDSSPDGLPVNCISYKRAREYCQHRDPAAPADLPTEAQLEYAAGALRSELYVWGADAPDCDAAVFARGSATGNNFAEGLPGNCHPPGVAQVKSGARDKLEIGGAYVFDLAGNLAELARDGWAKQEKCRAGLLLRNPDCPKPSPATPPVLKGGSWGSEPYELRAAFRARGKTVDDYPPDGSKGWLWLGPLVGFRCARPALESGGS